MDDRQPAASGASGCLLRVFWMALGNIGCFFCALAIATRRDAAFFSYLDIAFWGLALLIAAARYLDVRSGEGTTADGQPATMAHFRRHVMIMAAAFIPAWGLAHMAAKLLG